jgi:hypothetical protein
MTCPDLRQAVIRESFTWRGTPFEYGQCVKGVGVDCGRSIASWLNDSGAKRIDIAELPQLSPQWFMHRSDESFLDQVRRFAVEYRLVNRPLLDLWSGPVKSLPEPADIVVAKCGRDFAHSALVILWPQVIGAACEHQVTVWTNIFRSPQFAARELKFFDPFYEGKAA